MNCGTCGQRLKSDATFCAECGTRAEGTSQDNVPLVCPRCSRQNIPSAQYCDRCRQPLHLAPSAPRPLVCAHCYAENLADSVWCSACGKKIEKLAFVQRTLAGKAEMLRETQWGKNSRRYTRAMLIGVGLLIAVLVTSQVILLAPFFVLVIYALVGAIRGLFETEDWKKRTKKQKEYAAMQDRISALEDELDLTPRKGPTS